jgi:hypothetical protein
MLEIDSSGWTARIKLQRNGNEDEALFEQQFLGQRTGCPPSPSGLERIQMPLIVIALTPEIFVCPCTSLCKSMASHPSPDFLACLLQLTGSGKAFPISILNLDGDLLASELFRPDCYSEMYFLAMPLQK